MIAASGCEFDARRKRAFSRRFDSFECRSSQRNRIRGITALLRVADSFSKRRLVDRRRIRRPSNRLGPNTNVYYEHAREQSPSFRPARHKRLGISPRSVLHASEQKTAATPFGFATGQTKLIDGLAVKRIDQCDRRHRCKRAACGTGCRRRKMRTRAPVRLLRGARPRAVIEQASGVALQIIYLMHRC